MSNIVSSLKILNLSSLEILGDVATASVFFNSLLEKSPPNPKLFPQIMLMFGVFGYNVQYITFHVDKEIRKGSLVTG